MKVSFPTKALKAALAEIHNATGAVDAAKKPTEAALFVRVDDNRVTTLTGLSQERVVQARHTGVLSSAEPGSFAINRSDFDRVVTVAPGDTVDLNVTTNLSGETSAIHVTSGTARFTLAAVQVKEQDFVWPEKVDTAVAVLDGDVLSRVLRQLRTATQAANTAVPVLVYRDGDGLGVALSDGYRLAAAKVPAIEIADFDQLRIPFSYVASGVNYLAQHQAKIAITQNDVAMTFTGGPATLRVRHYDAPTPDLAKLRSMWEFPTTIAVNAEQLLDVIERVTALAYDSPAIDVTLRDHQLEVSLQQQEKNPASRAVDLVPATYNVAEGTTFGINGRYLKSAVESTMSPSVTIGFSTPDKPLRIVGDAPGFETVVMPIRRR